MFHLCRDTREPILIIFHRYVAEKIGFQTCFIFHLTYLVLLHYLAKQETHKLHFCHLNAVCCFANKCTQHWKHANYHIVTAVPPFICKMINCMHQTGPKKEVWCLAVHYYIMLSACQICHGVIVDWYVKNMNCTSFSLDWKLIDILIAYPAHCVQHSPASAAQNS